MGKATSTTATVAAGKVVHDESCICESTSNAARADSVKPHVRWASNWNRTLYD